MFKRLKEILKQVQNDMVKIFERIKKMIYKGSDAVKDIYVGNQQISEVYHGETLVYSASKIKYAGMSYVPGHVDSNHPSGFSDGNGVQYPIRCLCLIRSDGAAKAIPFALYNDTVNLAPTDEQVEAAEWVAGNYTAAYNSGYYNNWSSAVGPINRWIPAKAVDNTTGLEWDIPQYQSIRFVRNESATMWGWPISAPGYSFSSQISSDYSVTVDNGVCYIYYQGNLIKTIRAR